LVIFFAASVNLSFLRMLADASGNDCFQLVLQSNGNQYLIENTSEAWFSTSKLSFTTINNCPTSQNMKDLKVIIESWSVNSNIVKDNLQSQLQGNPWLVVTPSFSNNNVLVTMKTQDCTGDFCDWTKVQSGAKHTISLIYTLNSPLNTSTINKIYIDGTTPTPVPPSKKGNLEIHVNNIAPQIGNIIATVTETTNSFQQNLTFNSNSSVQKINSVASGYSYKISLPGVSYPKLGKHDSPISANSDVVKENQTTVVTLNYSTESITHNVNFNISGENYTGTAAITLIFQNTDRYTFIGNNLDTNSKSSTYNFLTEESKISFTISQPSGWSVTYTPNYIDPQTSSVNITIKKTGGDTGQSLGGYYQTWSARWASSGNNHSLANLPSYLKYILISFATPGLSYTKGSGSIGGTGLQFNSDFNVVKDAISIAHKNNPDQKFILSVGGATYPWNSPNYQGIADLVDDLGLDGVDIDLENLPGCSNLNTANLTCRSDQDIIKHINTLRGKLSSGKLLTAAVFSVGGYGTPEFPTTKYGPASDYSGMWVNPLKSAGSSFDAIFIMSYDASNVYSPTDAFNAYRSIYKGKLLIGLEVPPEAWGGHVLTVDEAKGYANYSKNNGGSGLFIWSLEKTNGTTNAYSFFQPICNIFGLNDCNKPIPLD